MKPYIGLVHQEADSAYGITFPDAPGCFAASDTLDDIFVKAEEALGLWLEAAATGQAMLPAPRDLSDIRNDVRWTASFADTALVIAVPAPDLHLSQAA